MTRTFLPAAALASALGFGSIGAAQAQVADQASEAERDTAITQVDDIVVQGRGERRIGSALSASEGSVSGEDLRVRPLLRVGELAEAVPGLLAVQHSGAGKANQYFLRGYNLDHGTDFSLSLDGAPLNFPTHGHGQGYLDVNHLIPESIGRIDYRKGPYRADDGDFSLAANAHARTRDAFDRPFVGAEAGEDGYRRLVAGGSFGVADGSLLLIGETKANDGPWQLAEGLRHYAGFGKYRRDSIWGVLRLGLSFYDAEWRPTEQIPVRAIGDQVADRFGSLDPSLRGRTQRQILTASLQGGDTTLSAYVQHYDFNLLSNFTFFLDDPVDGDQLEQTDRRWVYGARVRHAVEVNDRLVLAFGGETRFDDISELGLYHTAQGRRIAARSVYAIEELSGGLFAEATWRPTDRLTVFGGLRADAYRFEVTGLDGDAHDGSVDDDIVSPKLGLSYTVADGVALYWNYGEGFHSNDARGVTYPTDPAPGLVKGTGKEVGLRFERGRLIATADYWWATSDSELLYSGDAGTVEPSGASDREGYELTSFYRPLSWLTIDGVWAVSRARFRDAPGADRVPGALESVGELGVSAVFPRWTAAARVRYLGPHALVEDDSVRSEGTTLVNLRSAFTPGRYDIYAELLNALNSDGADTDYFYATRLPGEPAEGVEGVNSRSVEPRMIRIGVKVSL